jgi:hypothetical protein
MKRMLFLTLLGVFVFFMGCGRQKKSIGNNPPKIPPKDPFYTYTGCRDWYRFPLKYPYQVLMTDNWDDGSLEKYDGGNIEDPNRSSHYVMLENIIDIHLHENYVFFRKEDWTYGYLQYSTGEVRLFETEEKLKQFCLLGPDDFKPLEYYFKLFEKGTVMYPPVDPSKSKTVRNNVIAHFNKMVVKMYPDRRYSNEKNRGPACIEVIYERSETTIEIETGKITWGELPPEAQDMIDQWLPLHRDELLEMWKARKLKELPPLTRSVLN